MQRLSPLLILAGVLLIGIGLLARWGGLSWLGRLPGDLRLERGAWRLFVPITSMVLVSLALTLVLNLLKRLR